MRALQWDAEKGRVFLIDVAKPRVEGPFDVLVKVMYSGVCGTDLHIMQKEFPAAPKIIMGHEFTGVVEEVGSGVDGLDIGTKVAVDPYNNCHHCRFCIRGQPNYCIYGGGRTGLGTFKDGGWAEYCVAQSAQVYRLPDDVSLATSVLIEPYACVERGWETIGEIPADAQILIMGAGIIGLLWSCLLHHRGYRDISVSEPNEDRRQMAENLGLGIKVIHPAELANRFAGKDAAVEGYDLVVDCSGSPKAIEAIFPMMRRGAKLCIFGCSPKGTKINIEPHEIFAKELTIIGSLIDPFTFPKSVPTVISMAQNYLDLDKLAIKTYALDQYELAFSELKKGVVSKALFQL